MAMFGITDLGLFIIAGLMLNLTPGVDMLYVIHRAASQGLKAGIVACLGITGGCMIHIFFAVIGLSAILAASSTAFLAIKYIGAGYLVYLGITMIVQKRPSQVQIASTNSDDLFSIFKQGVLINVLNPKVALFFLAFIPQFIDPDSTQKPLAFAVLGLIMNFNGTLVIFAIAWLTVKAKDKFKLMLDGGLALKRIIGLVFIGLGIKLAVDR